MKKVIFAIAALGLISLTSCKKKYTCECTGGVIPTVTSPEKIKKSDAETWCNAYNTTNALAGGSCKLK